MRRNLVHWLLALSIALLAPGGYVHALTHLSDGLADSQERGDDAGTPASSACELCAAYAVGDGGGAGPTATPVLVLPAAAPAAKPAEPSLPSLALTRFASRAPPSAS